MQTSEVWNYLDCSWLRPYASYRVSKATNKQPIDISASGIGFDLNTRLLWPGLVESTWRAHMRSE